jgi:ClpP class serine protease
MLSNQNIDSLILSGDRWAIDSRYALQYIHRYLADLNAREAGANLSDLGIKQRKRAMLPDIAVPKGDYQFSELKSNSDDFDALTDSDIPKGSFAVLKLFGAMRADGDWCSYGMRDMADWIDMCSQNDRISGLLIKANTGGGEVLAGQILRNALAECPKPVVVHFDTLASAGCDGCFPATEWIASGNVSQVGSIGVFSSMNKKVIKWYQKNIEDIYSTKSTKKNKALRALLAGDSSLLVSEIDEAADIFHNSLKQYRPQAHGNEDVREGDIFYAEKGKVVGLCDGIGTINYAFRRLHWHTQNFK